MSQVGGENSGSNPLSDVALLIDRNAATLVRIVRLEEELTALRAAHAGGNNIFGSATAAAAAAAASGAPWSAETSPEPEPAEWRAMEERVVVLTAKYNARLRVLARWVDRTTPASMEARGTHRVTPDGTGRSVSVPAGMSGPTAWDMEQLERWSKLADIEDAVDAEAAGEVAK